MFNLCFPVLLGYKGLRPPEQGPHHRSFVLKGVMRLEVQILVCMGGFPINRDSGTTVSTDVGQGIQESESVLPSLAPR